MQILPALLAVAVAISHTTRSNPVLVTAVIDGDTITVATVGRVRLARRWSAWPN